MRDPYIKRRAQQLRYRATRAMIIEAGFWCLVCWLIYKAVCAAIALYGCPQGADCG